MKPPSHRVNGARLESARAARKLTKKQLADAVGVWQSQIKRWTDGDTGPSGENLMKLARALDVTPDYLTGADEAAPSATEQDKIVEEVQRLFGRGAAEALRAMQRLTPHHRAILAGRIVGWIEGLAEYEQTIQHEQMPITQFDRDREELRRRSLLSEEVTTGRHSPTDSDPVPAGGVP